jgi:hypothetical protein
MRRGPAWLPILAMLALAAPTAARAHPCVQELAQAAQRLDLLNRQIMAIELTSSGPYVLALRNDYHYQMMLFVQLRAQCEQAVREENGGTAPATAQAGCTKDTDCKGDRICVSGACVHP